MLIFTVNSNFLVIAGFVACMVIFVFPLFLLGTVTPSLVKFSVDDSGSVVGKLNASNTIGSIIGTFVPTFISIPTVGTSITFLFFSGILLILSFAYFLSAKTGLRKNKKDELDILILGNGTGTFATQCKRYFDNVNIEAVEIDEKITELAEKYFDFISDVFR